MTVRCDTLEALVRAVRALFAAHAPEVVKNRVGEVTRDVVAVIRFRGVLVEVQFHLGLALDAKALSHAAYNVTRANAKTDTRRAALLEAMQSCHLRSRTR